MSTEESPGTLSVRLPVLAAPLASAAAPTAAAASTCHARMQGQRLDKVEIPSQSPPLSQNSNLQEIECNEKSVLTIHTNYDDPEEQRDRNDADSHCGPCIPNSIPVSASKVNADGNSDFIKIKQESSLHTNLPPPVRLVYLQFTALSIDYDQLSHSLSPLLFELVRPLPWKQFEAKAKIPFTPEQRKAVISALPRNPMLLPALLKLSDAQHSSERHATIAWRNLSYFAKDGTVRLQGVSGFLRPGMMLCVLGSPDSGVTTLFEVLNNRQHGGQLSGEILLNGRPQAIHTDGRCSGAGSWTAPSSADHLWKRAVGFLLKDDVHLANLTVRETLYFSARLRTPGGVSDEHIQFKISIVLQLLDLSHVADQMVGDEIIRGISGGERRRLSYALELVAGHSAIIADLPTNGLDSASAFALISNARLASRSGRSLMCSLVQPSPELLALFDFLMLMSKGSVIYFGPPSHVLPYLQSIGFEKPQYKSVPDWLEDLSGHPEIFFKGKMPPPLPFIAFGNRHKAVSNTPALAAPTRTERNNSELSLQKAKQLEKEKDKKAFVQAVTVAAKAGEWSDENELKASPNLSEDESDAANLDNPIHESPPQNNSRSPDNRSDNYQAEPNHEYAGRSSIGHAQNDVDVDSEHTHNNPESDPSGWSKISYRSRVWLHARSCYKKSIFYQELGSIQWREFEPDFLSEHAVAPTPLWHILLSPPFLQAYNSSLLVQLMLCLRRQFLLTIRNRTLLAATFLKMIVVGLIVGSLFSNLGTANSDARTRFGLFFFTLAFAAQSQVPFVPTILRLRTIYYRQTAASYFHGSAYYLAFVVLMIPMAIIEIFLFAIIVYGLCGLVNGEFSSEFGYYYLVLLLVDLVARSWLFFICNVSADEAIATAVTPVTLLTMAIFAGFLNPESTIPPGWHWFYYLSFFTYAFKGLCINEMQDLRFHCTDTELVPPKQLADLIPPFGTGGVQVCPLQTGQQVLALYDMSTDDHNLKWSMLANLCYFFIVFNVAACSAMLYFDFAPRDKNAAPQWTQTSLKVGLSTKQDQDVPVCRNGAKLESKNCQHHRDVLSQQQHQSNKSKSAQLPTVQNAEVASALVNDSGPQQHIPNLSDSQCVTRNANCSHTQSACKPDQVIDIDLDILQQANMKQTVAHDNGAIEHSKNCYDSSTPLSDLSSVAASTPSPAYLEWKNLSYSIDTTNVSTTASKPGTAGSGHNNGQKLLLDKVFGYSPPGCMTALMGVTGAGKSTLLDVLSGMKTGGHIAGQILINGKPKDSSTWAKLAGYVEQFDSHNPRSTVREAILFSAQLRLPKQMSNAQKQARVDSIIDMLDLAPFSSELIGNAELGGLSPDLRKKVSIAVEMVMLPSLLFLDEPTTGLESSGAISVMMAVRKLCIRFGISVLCTIHQPSAEIFSVFDSLLILRNGGRVAYFGAVAQVNSFLVDLGYEPCPQHVNIAEHVMRIVKGATARFEENPEGPDMAMMYLQHSIGQQHLSALKIPLTLAQPLAPVFAGAQALHANEAGAQVPSEPLSVRDSKLALAVPQADSGSALGMLDVEKLAATITSASKSVSTSASQPDISGCDHVVKSDSAKHSHSPVGFLGQLCVLLPRFWRSTVRDVQLLKMRAAVVIIIALLFGTLFYQLGYNQKDATNRVSFIYMSCLFPVFASGFVFPDIFLMRPVYFRERQAKMYSPLAYFLARLLADLPIQMLENALYCCIGYWMVGLTDMSSGTHFALFLLVYALVRCMGIALATLAGTITFMREQANSVLTVVGIIAMLFSGFLISENNMPRGWIWMHYASLFKYPIAALAINELKSEQFFCSPSEMLFLPVNTSATTLTASASESTVTNASSISCSLPADATNPLCYFRVCSLNTGQQVLDVFSMNIDDERRDLGIIPAFVAAFIVLAFLAHRFVNHVKR